jgi:hypothetical protein
MQVFVLGMHRSGTSLLSRLVHELGLFVGEVDELMPAQPCNVEGFWERLDVSELNELLLETAGGSWDCPPPLRTLEGTWSKPEKTEVAQASARARAIIARLDREGAWSVKDPRASLTWPFWRRHLPSARVLVAVRDPFEVGASLVARHGCTETLGLALWKAYNEAILRFTRPEERTVVVYHALLANPLRETERVARRLELELPPERIALAARVASTQLRTHRSVATARRLADPRYATLRRVYATLLAEAGVDVASALDVSRWPLAEDVNATDAAERFAALGRGWSKPEPQGVWSEHATAMLSLGPLRASKKSQRVRVRVALRPFIAGRCPSQRVRVTCAGAVVLEADLRTPQLHSLEFEVSQAPGVERMELTLHLPNATSPASLGTGADVRNLGVLLANVRIARGRPRAS